MENILSNSFLSDLTRDFLNVFHSFCLYKLAILKEGIFPTHLSYDHLRGKKAAVKLTRQHKEYFNHFIVRYKARATIPL
jgi:hypothetical protein